MYDGLVTDTRPSVLLAWDAAINLVLGGLLVIFPSGVVAALGVPETDIRFYPSILGAVLVGIGIALVVEYRQRSSGLGLRGAVAINMTGGIVLAAWLLFGDLALPLRGLVLLWGLVLLLVGLSGAELWWLERRRGDGS